MSSGNGTGIGAPGRGRGKHRRRARLGEGFAVFLRVFLWGHLMGIAIYLVHGAFWLVMVGCERLVGNRPPPLWITLRLWDPSVLGRWVLGILTLCLLLAGYRRQLGLDVSLRGDGSFRGKA
jgi:hypothetical protein